MHGIAKCIIRSYLGAFFLFDMPIIDIVVPRTVRIFHGCDMLMPFASCIQQIFPLYDLNIFPSDGGVG